MSVTTGCSRRYSQLSTSFYLLLAFLQSRRWCCHSFRPQITPIRLGLVQSPSILVRPYRYVGSNSIGTLLRSVVDDEKDLLSFDQAGAGIMDEDDKKKLEELKNYMDDGNPDVSVDTGRTSTN
jgi:hypothetical protein